MRRRPNASWPDSSESRRGTERHWNRCWRRAGSTLSFRAKRDLAELGRRLKQIESQFLDVVQAWAESIEAKDRYTHGHCGRVADLATALARRLGLEDDALMWFRMGAFLHDVGKTETPTEILNKPGPLY